MRKLTFLTIWFQVTCIVLICNLSFLSAYKRGSSLSIPYPTQLYPDLEFHRAIPASSGKVLGSSITADDARALIVERFIKRFRPDSPFLRHAGSIVEEADRYKIDFRLVPAIAMCESNLGIRLPSSDSFNAWGIAVYTNTNKGKHFEDWPAAITWVTKFISEKFYDKGITDLLEIGAIWAPPSVDNNYSWSRCVQGFMDKME
ncbi:MAG: hypothetical protein UV63_C0008G0014 [Microgenomates group bacterium GW2011_GWC1_43_11]|uniref:Mannosyl-glycoprotein endo-beta-N-acetylglucosamidase-like domain-containing protein n=2 Tax=Candidatus Gottesmaniibacteriota TaxID=1752720 RepID=A0A0G1IRC3_9BACT|nr:MAG: hypothetical protein UV63_C0008G0014 [Microgenomates group bacterium GW2011_GWC1_43_11]KKT39046.1 MAG: hypothetical protein UW22_C0002G0022 [Candidatus Gottesmanbacteria bacterium GW2011_GWB1_44_11c]KKT61508.1 MAG: hypothetical protein UW52_C0002G0022 [Candidatus Gottesmanbacteria bacterium GW2011_GWA1_44_24b]